MTSTASTSNPPLFLTPFGLLPASLPRQRPIRRFFSLLLDFLHGFHRVNVQSNTFSHPFWTSSVASTASTSNPPLSHSFWTSACLPATSTSNPPHFLAFLLHIYTKRTLKKFNFTPLSPTIFPTTHQTKNSRRDKPCGSI